MDDRIILSNAAAETRRSMTVKHKQSVDAGQTWNEGCLIYKKHSGYSDLVQISDNKVAILYEGGEKRYTDGIDFKIINISCQ